MKSLAKYFFEGLIFLVPVTVSVWAVYVAFVKVDRLLGLPVPGAGFVITITAITLIGYLASNFFTKRVFGYLEKTFARLPLVKILYSSIKDLVGAFVGDKKKFDKPVLVELSAEGSLNALGFITAEDLSFLGLNGSVAIYFPQSYNFAGNLVIVPAERVKPLDAESSEVMKFIVSGGVSGGM